METGVARESAAKLGGGRSRALTICAWALAAGVVVVLLFNLVRYSLDTERELRLIPWLAYDERVDFGYFYAAATLVYNGDAKNLYPARGDPVFYEGDPIFTTTRGDYENAWLLTRGNYYNPPALAMIEAPLAALDFQKALFLFTLFSGGALALFVVLAFARGRSLPELPVFLLGVAAFKPVHEAIVMGHPSLFFAAALAGGFLALQSRRPVLAGLALSVLALKPQWAVVPALFLLSRGQWRALATMAVASAAIVFLPFLATGFGTLKNYVQFLWDASRIDLNDAPHMFSWNGFFYKLNAAAPSRGLVYGLIALTLVPMLIAWRSRDLYLGVAATIVGMLLISTHSVWYDWSFLIVAGLFLVLRPSAPVIRVQTWVVLIAITLAASQSTAALLYPGHHFIDWQRKAFFSITPVAFLTLVWIAVLAFWDNRDRFRVPLPRTAKVTSEAVP